MVHTMTINDGWRLSCKLSDAPLEVKVPGSVYNDLLNHGLMEDPFYRDNELKSLELMKEDYTYTTTFSVTDEVLADEEILLRFDGIDTLANISLNGELIAKTNNMHRTWEFPVKSKLKKENNELKVELLSPIKFIREQNAIDPILANADTMAGFPHLRKAHCMFGWDWGPMLPDAGIWKPVSLVGITKARLDGVNIHQAHTPGQVLLSFDIDVEILGDEKLRRFGKDDTKLTEYCYDITITSPEGVISYYSAEDACAGIVIDSPELWWPNGYGEQPLYTVELELKEAKGGKSLDKFVKRIGLRTMTMSREKDEYGESFCHEVNGVKVFAMGADYIPQDSLLPRVSKERIYKLLSDAKAANHNCVRVWGGGHYPSDDFYDACDELGLMVWQDFMFACAVYNLTEEFEANIKAEMRDNIKRIRNHASLGLWCGNNEMEMFVKEGDGWITKPSQVSDYIKMYEYIIPKVLKEYDPDTFYWPASPSSGGAFDEPNDENRGDVHYWDVWHGSKPITEYRKFYFRYVSEFGFQAFPSLKTCESFTEPEDRNIFSYVMEKHQRNSVANGKIMNYMEQTYLYPSSFATVLYASQLLQADAIRYGVEHFRRNRGRCMGAVVWQLNDIWPVASWSSIDYFGRWKALHYAEKRFFSPILLSCEEEGILSQNTNPNAEPYEVKKSIRLNVSNETLEEQRVTVKWALRDACARVIRSGESDAIVPELSAIWFPKEDMMDADLYNNYVSYECIKEGEVVSSGTVLFTAPKQFEFVNPELKFRVEGDEIVVSASAYAKSVEILNENEDMILSDNYFDMNAGEKRVKIISGAPNGLKIRSVYDIR